MDSDLEHRLARLNRVPVHNSLSKLAELEQLKKRRASKTSTALLTQATAFTKWAFKEFKDLGETIQQSFVLRDKEFEEWNLNCSFLACLSTIIRRSLLMF